MSLRLVLALSSGAVAVIALTVAWSMVLTGRPMPVGLLLLAAAAALAGFSLAIERHTR